MTVVDNADTVNGAGQQEQQQDSPPDAGVQDDGTDTSTDADNTPNSEGDEHREDDDPAQSGTARERRYRLRLRDAERERDELRDTLARTRQSIVDTAVAAAGVDARLLPLVTPWTRSWATTG
jgi:hypothetical protein